MFPFTLTGESELNFIFKYSNYPSFTVFIGLFYHYSNYNNRLYFLTIIYEFFLKALQMLSKDRVPEPNTRLKASQRQR